MRDIHQRLSLRRRSDRPLTGWRWVLVVAAGSVVLLAALVILGLGVAAKMGVNVATQPPAASKTEPPKAAKTASDDSAGQNTPDSQSSGKPDQVAVAGSGNHPVNPTVCDDLARTYKGLSDDLEKTKPSVPVSTGMTGVVSTVAKGTYNSLAHTFNDTLEGYESDYGEKASANGCLNDSPFSTISKALEL